MWLKSSISFLFAVNWLVIAIPSGASGAQADEAPLDTARRAFYDGRYEEAAGLAFELRAGSPHDLAAYELRTSALLFQLKRLLGDDRKRLLELKECTPCGPLMRAFQADTAAAQAVARERIKADASDETALFFLGKIDLNHVWLQLGPLGRRSGWSEYREARQSLDAVLAANPTHVRARVARAWIDYVVDTRMPWGTKWLFGGGSRKRGLAAVKASADTQGDFYSRVEARFALWEMLVRERDLRAAAEVARGLARDFPGNSELARFVERHNPA
jgi:hypothetical protein